MRRREAHATEWNWFVCTVDDWRRTYRFGINQMTKHFPEPYDEWDLIEVFGTVRHHEGASRRGRKLPWEKVEVWISPPRVLVEEWQKEPKAVGGVQTEKRKIQVHTRFPADVYASLIPCLAAGHFKEIHLRVRELHRRHGLLYSISFEPKETPEEDL